MLIDVHTHVGQFEQTYCSPANINDLMTQVGVNYYAVSSTTMCEENYEKVLVELLSLIDYGGERVLPVMWVTPDGLKGNIAWFLESDVKWRCVKVHPFLHPYSWEPKGQLFSEVIDIARELKVPLLIHTGDEDCCVSQNFVDIIKRNSDIVFILAHGRPQKEALRLVSLYDNAYVDSAFMSVDYMKEFVDNGLGCKLLWGTDMCIPKQFYPELNLVDYYKTKLSKFYNAVSKEQYELVTYKNACKVFGIKNT